MIARYVKGARRPRSWDFDDDEPVRPDLTVDDNVTVETGLLWPDGEPVLRSPNPIGFGRDEEW